LKYKCRFLNANTAVSVELLNIYLFDLLKGPVVPTGRDVLGSVPCHNGGVCSKIRSGTSPATNGRTVTINWINFQPPNDAESTRMLIKCDQRCPAKTRHMRHTHGNTAPNPQMPRTSQPPAPSIKSSKIFSPAQAFESNAALSGRSPLPEVRCEDPRRVEHMLKDLEI
jgi:hypothetical protein